MKTTHAGAFSLLALTQLGAICVTQPEFPEPCEMDPLGCGAADKLVIDPDCTRSDPLVVRLGNGVSEYTPLLPEEPPEVHYGIQGGQHFFLGVEIENPELDSPGLEIEFNVRGAFDCSLDVPAGECEGWASFATRDLVVTDPALFEESSGRLTTTGYVVVLDEDLGYWFYDRPARVEVSAGVRDACDRRGSVTFDYIVEPVNINNNNNNSSDSDTGETSTSGTTGTTE